jgi:hypothetical protein
MSTDQDGASEAVREWWASGVGVTLVSNGVEQNVRILFSKLPGVPVTGAHIELVEKSAFDKMRAERDRLKEENERLRHDILFLSAQLSDDAKTAIDECVDENEKLTQALALAREALREIGLMQWGYCDDYADRADQAEAEIEKLLNPTKDNPCT